MHWFKELIDYAVEYKNSSESMKKITCVIADFVECMEYEMPEKVSEFRSELEMAINGPHFTEFSAEKAVSEMKNDDGTTGEHWTIDETSTVAEAKNIDFEKKKFNIYDWYYTMNMIYSDFYLLHRGDATKVSEMAILFLDDKDAPEGKAWIYYEAMNKAKIKQSGV